MNLRHGERGRGRNVAGAIRRSGAGTITVGMIAVGALVLTPAVAVSAATLVAPSSARVGGRITVSAHGVTPGRYTLFLEFTELAPAGVAATGCLAKVGSAATAVGGSVKISGTLPKRLACHQAEGPTEGYVTVKAGRYALDLGGFLPPAGFSGGESFLRRAIHLTG
jgi:hypothetical protein